MRSLRLVCLIDLLASGGAQRQLCCLAVAFKKHHNVDVTLLTYHRNDFFMPMLLENGISCHTIKASSPLGRAVRIREYLRDGRQDAVLAFLPSPCMYAELASLPRRRWGLVVSERSARGGSHRTFLSWRRLLHNAADYVTTNSHTNRLMIERSVPWLRGKVVTVYNCVDLDVFRPSMMSACTEKQGFRFAVVASHQHNKNLANLVKALAIVRCARPKTGFVLDWYGEAHMNNDSYVRGAAMVREQGLAGVVRFHPPTQRIADVYRSCDAVVLPSFYEGLPNAICEAMACGRAVLMSRVCDADNLVTEGLNGFLFDPGSPEDIARSLMRFMDTNDEHRERMGRESRQKAEALFAPSVVCSRYMDIIEAAASRKRVAFPHWPEKIPPSAYITLDA